MSPESHVTFSALGRRLRSPAVTTLMAAALENPDVLSLAAGFTDTTTLPREEISRAVLELAAREGPPEHLQYGTNIGRARLRELLARHTAQLDGAQNDASVSGADTLIGNGSQQLLQLATQVLCDVDDIVLVESPTYFVFLEILHGLGVRSFPLPQQPDGRLDVVALRQQAAVWRKSGEVTRVKALYLQGYFANPSGRCRSEDEKNELAAALHEEGLVVPVIEDAAYRDLWFERTWPARSVLALDAWSHFPRLYLGTLTKPFASGLKVGYGHATHQPWLERIAWLKGHADFGTAHFNQGILEQVVQSRAFEAHLVRVRPRYQGKLRQLDQALEAAGLRALGWTWTPPGGGLTLWLRAPAGVDTHGGSRLWRAALEERVLYVPGDLFFPSPSDRAFVRLSFGVLEGEQLSEAAQRFTRAARRAGALDSGS